MNLINNWLIVVYVYRKRLQTKSKGGIISTA